jgi:DNA-binding LytR/AlgR family response regulator
MNCIIVDDDAVSIKYTEMLIKKNPYLTYLGSFTSATAAVSALEDLDVDLIFLDVEMPEMTGFEFITKLQDIPSIIFVSSKKEYAADAYSFQAADYLVKPFAEDRFNASIKDLAAKKKVIAERTEIHDSFFVKDKGSLVQVFINEIVFIEALSDYVQICTADKKYTVLSSLKGMELLLPSAHFKRVHRSFIVNKYKILEVDEHVIVMKDKNIPLSRSHRSDFMQWINII